MSKYRSFKKLFFLLITSSLWGAVAQAASRGNYATLPETIQKINTNIGELRQRSHNLEVEVHQVEERFGSMEVIVDGLRKQVTELSRNIRDQSEASKVSLESRMGNLELMARRVHSDLQLVKTRYNDSSTSSSQYKQDIQEIKQQMNAQEKLFEQQERNIENLQIALKVLTEALQVGDDKENSPNEYRVKPGDSLDKIAQTYG
ncbi:MAG: hypothetical protein H0W50_09555, partial [Parachlamydiaceae bacterium]|nr:hypothetical protein [Parachlamydiaceae bacterium]